jgi:hypothetical protein
MIVRCLAVILVCLFSFSCKKTVDKKKEQIIMNAITSGYWKVELYAEDGVAMTDSYTEYEFKFNENETLNALKPGTIIPGTWKPDIVQLTITTDFPGALDPINRLIGVWTLRDSDWDYVKAENNNNGIHKLLQLRKK